MARRSSMALVGLTTIFTLTTPITAFHFNLPHLHHDAPIHVRQAGPVVASTITVPSASNPILTFPSGSPPPTPTIGMSSSANTNTNNDTTPTFPTTTIHDPIATICPGDPSPGIFTLFPTLPELTSMTINATAKLPGGGSTVFQSTTPVPFPSPIDAEGGGANARIAIDDKGCQTLFAPRVTAICSTVVKPAGVPEVTVTDCEQYITFSSETKICPTVPPVTTSRNTIVEAAASPAAAAVPAAVGAAGGVGDSSNGLMDTPAVPVQATVQGDADSAGAEQAAQESPAVPSQPAQDAAAVTAAAASAAPEVASPTLYPTDDAVPLPSPLPSSDTDTNTDTDASPAPSPASETAADTSPTAAAPDDTTTEASADIPTLAVTVVPVAEPTDAAPSNATDLRRRQDSPAAGTTFSASNPILTLPPQTLPTQLPGTYYAAHWYDVARGGVPSSVRAVECPVPGTAGSGIGGGSGGGDDDGCTTWTEKWSVSTLLRTVTVTKPVTYSGAVVVTDGTLTFTSTINIATFVTTTSITNTPVVVKQRLLDGNRVAAQPVETGAANAAAAAAGVFAGDAGTRNGNGSDGRGTRTVRMTSTITETTYEGVATSVIAAAGVGGAAGAGGGADGETGPDGIRTVVLNAVPTS